MPESLAYVILGRGRWARKLCPIISGEGRSVVAIEETRQLPFETEPDYVDRLAVAMKASGAQIAWLCVLPGPHVSLMIQAAIDAGLHVIAEKPWYGSNEDTQKLQSLARANLETRKRTASLGCPSSDSIDRQSHRRNQLW